jgi:molybdopterin-guanine dinucleotide biosynthesis protein A
MRLLGAVLAGGQSRRFGSDKAMARLHGRPLIEHAIATLIPFTERVVIIGREDSIPDRPRGGHGPLAGINAAIHYALRFDYDAVLTTGCDVPALPPGLAGLLAGGGYIDEMPIVGLWPTALALDLDTWLVGASDRSVRGWARHAGVPAVTLGAELPNINTIEDLKSAEAPSS